MRKSNLMLVAAAMVSLSVFTGCAVKGSPKEDMKKQEMKKDDMKKDGMKHDDMKKDDMKKDDMKKDDMKKDDMKKDGMKHDDMKKVSTKKDDMKQMMNEGEPAPDFKLQGIDGKTYQLSDLKGKKVYLKFWASWCSICLSTLQDANDLAKAAGDDYVVLSVVAPNINGEKSADDFKNWFAKLDYKALPVGLDEGGKALEAYGVRSYPTSAFIGSDGVLVKKHIGYMKAEEIKETLKNIK